MRIPTFASADVEHGIAVVFDDVATVAKVERERGSGVDRMGKENAQGIVTASAQLLFREAFVLKEEKILAGGKRDGFHFQCAGKLDEKNAIASGGSAEVDGGIAFQGVIGEDGGIELVMERVKWNRRRRETRKGVRVPDIVETNFVDDARLAEHEILRAHVVEQNVERTGEDAVDACVEKVAGRGGVFFKQD